MSDSKGFDIYIEFGREIDQYIHIYMDDMTKETINHIINEQGKCVIKFNWFDPGVILLKKEELLQPDPEQAQEE